MENVGAEHETELKDLESVGVTFGRNSVGLGLSLLPLGRLGLGESCIGLGCGIGIDDSHRRV